MDKLTWNLPRDAVAFLARSAAFSNSCLSGFDVARVVAVGGANPPAPGILVFLDLAMFLSLWTSFLATRSAFSSAAFS